jgi:S1-C subfamily serine protease
MAAVGSPATAQQAVEPGWLGMEIAELSAQAVNTLNLNQPRALLVVLPVSGGPAERATLRAADLILQLNAAPVTTTQASLHPSSNSAQEGRRASVCGVGASS